MLRRRIREPPLTGVLLVVIAVSNLAILAATFPLPTTVTFCFVLVKTAFAIVFFASNSASALAATAATSTATAACACAARTGLSRHFEEIYISLITYTPFSRV